MTHRLPFDLRDPAFVRREIRESRERLEVLSGERVFGFRAPSWGVSNRLLKALAESGYRYDASSFPSWTLYLLRLMVMRRREGPRTGRLRAPIRQMFFVRPSPHVVSARLGSLVEIPVSTVPVIRVPVYHTLAFLLPARVFEALLAALQLRRGPLNYAFHAVDFLDLAEDQVDSRLRSHPGMDRSLGEKIEHARAALTALGRAGDLCSLREIAGRVQGR
jgi:peptidoglycan/xylan/chitin deacetylase (PgdA/CDA1 family)